ncbi:MAG: MBL fold metallo-hydrolase [Bacteroidales bacterium]|nr:MBL fold metallo-hydrolase [Bacteroidales bacterium]
MLTIKTFVFNPLLVNCYVIHNHKEAIIVDPSCYDENEQLQLKQYIEQQQLEVKHIICTHFHFDHLMGAAFTCSTWNLPLSAHKDYVFLAGNFDISTQSMYFGFSVKNPPKPKVLLQDNDTIQLHHYTFNILHTPGHSLCSISIYEKETGIVITGDTLFEGGVGRTDLAGGDWQQLLHSIRTKLLTLPEETIVYPGHGGQTTIKQEKLYNTFLG